MLILTADHGCDPTWPGTDHTRERIPILALSKQLASTSIGWRPTFADIAATVARHLEITPSPNGEPFIRWAIGHGEIGPRQRQSRISGMSSPCSRT
jgi:phosphopentomutase